jgi:hypothetical protein
MADKEWTEQMDGLAVNGERKIAREGEVLCISTGKKSIPANTTYRARKTAHQPLYILHGTMRTGEGWRVSRVALRQTCSRRAKID